MKKKQKRANVQPVDERPRAKPLKPNRSTRTSDASNGQPVIVSDEYLSDRGCDDLGNIIFK